MSSPSHTNSMWEEALKILPESDRATINTPAGNKLEILNDIITVVEDKKALCLRKRWKYKKGKEVIIIRDQLDKIAAWVQRFKDVGSTIVQYDPVHAALPWAAVLFILQCATNDSQTFGAMVDGIERVSHILPRYAILEEACLKQQPLSNAQSQLELSLTKLYTAILRYLVTAKRYFSTSTARRVLSSAYGTPENRVQRYLDVVSKKAADVDSCLLVIQSEANKNIDGQTTSILEHLLELQKPIIRSSTQIFELHRMLSRQERNRISLWLSQVRNSLHHKLEGEGYLPGSGLWLFKREEFVRWRDSSSSAILWLHGIPGCGKTKLIYNTIQTFIHDNSSSPNPAPVAYFYCARNPAEPERSNPDEILRSLVKQLAFTADGNLNDLALKEFQRRDQEAELEGAAAAPLRLSEAKDMIIAFLERDPATIIIDALDECDPVRRHELLSVLDDILQRSLSVVKVVVASRDDGDICCHLANLPNVYIRADENRHDIERFINHSLAEALSSGRLLNGKMSLELQAEVLDTLKKRGQGMFRWVAMQIDSLCDHRRIKIENDVRQELGNLPQTLRKSYAKTYQRVLDLARPSRVIAERVFKWLLCAQKLMSASELIAAVTFVSEHHVLTTENILDICSSLVVVDEHGHFRFAHLSVREYLESLDTYATARCHSFVLHRCLESYLNTSVDWQSQLHSTLDLEVKPYAMLYWPLHCQEVGDPRQDQMLAIVTEAFIFAGPTDAQTIDLQLAKQFSWAFKDWLNDVWSASRYSGTGDYESAVLLKLESAASPSFNPQFVACTFDFVWLLDWLKASGWNNWNIPNHQEESCISLAAKWGNARAILWLLDDTHIDPEALTNALSVAINQGQLDIAMVLTERGANGFADSPGEDSPLHDAVSLGHLDLARIILNQSQHFDSCTFADALCVAFVESPEKLFPLLWDACIKLTAPDYFRVLLFVQMEACSEGRVFEDPEMDGLYLKMCDYLLISESAEINKIHRLWELLSDLFLDLLVLPDGNLGTHDRYERQAGFDSISYERQAGLHLIELCQTAKGSQENWAEIIEIMLSLGANLQGIPNMSEHYLKQGIENLLLLDMCNADEGDLWQDGVRMLLDRGVNTNATDEKGRTPLMFATKKGNPTLMEVLLVNGATPEQVDKKGQSATVHALKKGNTKALSVLVRKGVNINVSVMGGKTPLEIAISQCGHGMIRHLRESGARRPGSKIHRNGVSVPFLSAEACSTCTATLLECSASEQDQQSGVHNIFEKLTALSAHRSFDGITWQDDSPNSPSDTGHEGKQAGAPFSTTYLDMDKILPNTRSWEDGLTLLQAAICVANQAVIKAFLDLPVDVNAVDNQGFSALHYAAVSRFYSGDLIELLLSYKADPHLQDRNGRTPLHLAAAAAGWAAKANVRSLLEATPRPELIPWTVMAIQLSTSLSWLAIKKFFRCFYPPARIPMRKTMTDRHQ